MMSASLRETNGLVRITKRWRHNSALTGFVVGLVTENPRVAGLTDVLLLRLKDLDRLKHGQC
jgi:hypothetical protein